MLFLKEVEKPSPKGDALGFNIHYGSIAIDNVVIKNGPPPSLGRY